MARAAFGDFEHIEPAAVLGSIAVDPDYTHHLVGTALLPQLPANHSALQIQVVRSQSDVQHYRTTDFLSPGGLLSTARSTKTHFRDATVGNCAALCWNGRTIDPFICWIKQQPGDLCDVLST